MVDPPWRLDPLQTILRVAFPSKKKEEEDEPDEDPTGSDRPGSCPGCGISGCGLTICSTCYCPGIFCIGPGGCCFPAGCSFVGLIIRPDTSGACASLAWVDEQLFNCCGFDSPCVDVPAFEQPPGFYPPGTTPSFALP